MVNDEPLHKGRSKKEECRMPESGNANGRGRRLAASEGLRRDFGELSRAARSSRACAPHLPLNCAYLRLIIFGQINAMSESGYFDCCNLNRNSSEPNGIFAKRTQFSQIACATTICSDLNALQEDEMPKKRTLDPAGTADTRGHPPHPIPLPQWWRGRRGVIEPPSRAGPPGNAAAGSG